MSKEWEPLPTTQACFILPSRTVLCGVGYTQSPAASPLPPFPPSLPPSSPSPLQGLEMGGGGIIRAFNTDVREGQAGQCFLCLSSRRFAPSCHIGEVSESRRIGDLTTSNIPSYLCRNLLEDSERRRDGPLHLSRESTLSLCEERPNYRLYPTRPGSLAVPSPLRPRTQRSCGPFQALWQHCGPTALLYAPFSRRSAPSWTQDYDPLAPTAFSPLTHSLASLCFSSTFPAFSAVSADLFFCSTKSKTTSCPSLSQLTRIVGFSDATALGGPTPSALSCCGHALSGSTYGSSLSLSISFNALPVVGSSRYTLLRVKALFAEFEKCVFHGPSLLSLVLYISPCSTRDALHPISKPRVSFASQLALPIHTDDLLSALSPPPLPLYEIEDHQPRALSLSAHTHCRSPPVIRIEFGGAIELNTGLRTVSQAEADSDERRGALGLGLPGRSTLLASLTRGLRLAFLTEEDLQFGPAPAGQVTARLIQERSPGQGARPQSRMCARQDGFISLSSRLPPTRVIKEPNALPRSFRAYPMEDYMALTMREDAFIPLSWRLPGPRPSPFFSQIPNAVLPGLTTLASVHLAFTSPPGTPYSTHSVLS
ncbi:hypothetical protein NMY22_g6484 [Coprinellus aureogranulatus]|nr:hypothetical protein NMY22_g6484 [Coprinellus aureogranulatus]